MVVMVVEAAVRGMAALFPARPQATAVAPSSQGIPTAGPSGSRWRRGVIVVGSCAGCSITDGWRSVNILPPLPATRMTVAADPSQRPPTSSPLPAPSTILTLPAVLTHPAVMTHPAVQFLMVLLHLAFVILIVIFVLVHDSTFVPLVAYIDPRGASIA